MQDLRDGILTVDVLHDIDLADLRPVRVVASECSSNKPKGRPVPKTVASSHVRHLDRCLYAKLATGWRSKVAPLTLDPSTRPCAAAASLRHDPEVAVFAGVGIKTNVARGASVGLDFTSSPLS